PDEVRADEAGPPGYENPHQRAPPSGRIIPRYSPTASSHGLGKLPVIAWYFSLLNTEYAGLGAGYGRSRVRAANSDPVGNPQRSSTFRARPNQLVSPPPQKLTGPRAPARRALPRIVRMKFPPPGPNIHWVRTSR